MFWRIVLQYSWVLESFEDVNYGMSELQEKIVVVKMIILLNIVAKRIALILFLKYAWYYIVEKSLKISRFFKFHD